MTRPAVSVSDPPGAPQARSDSSARSGLDRITPVILTYNEAENIGRTLAKLCWARRVVVLDSLSSDETKNICLAAGNVDWFERRFDRHADQWNFAISRTRIDTEWILALDADYLLSDALVSEIGGAVSGRQAGWRSRFKYKVLGRDLRASLYPPAVVLFRRGRGAYVQDGHTQRLAVDGDVGDLSAFIHHDDRKPLSRWFTSQAKYAGLEADHLLAADAASLGAADRLRLAAFPAPFMALAYVLFVRGCVFDGLAGWYYALQRLLSEVMIALALIERRQKPSEN